MTTVLNIVTYNVFCAVIEPVRIYGVTERAHRVKDVIQSLQDIDVVVLCEVIAPSSRSIIIPDMKSIGFSYRTEELTSSIAFPGGVIIFSRHPITMHDMTLFGDKCITDDCLAAKGVAFARIRKNDEYFNVFASHMQAWPSVESQTVREQQLDQIFQFMQVLNIPKTEPVLFCGDLNIDWYHDNDHLKHFMNKLQLSIPPLHQDSHMFTVDPKENALVGADDPKRYYNEEYPDGCVQEYFQTLQCPCCPEVFLDYTLFSSSHLQPVESNMRVIIHKVPPFKIKMSLTKEVEIRDVSDHFPVVGHFVFTTQSTSFRDQLIKTGSVSSSNLQNTALALSVIVFLSVLTVTLFVILMKRVIRWKTNAFMVEKNLLG